MLKRWKRQLDGFVWTQAKPSKCGYYWVKGGPLPKHSNPRILRFRISQITGGSSRIEPEDGPLSSEGWKWFAGPIPSPSNVELSLEEGGKEQR